jgi:hypothetical protein
MTGLGCRVSLCGVVKHPWAAAAGAAAAADVCHAAPTLLLLLRLLLVAWVGRHQGCHAWHHGAVVTHQACHDALSWVGKGQGCHAAELQLW